MLSTIRITVILGASLLIVGCAASEVPAPATQQSNSSASDNSTPIYSIEDVRQKTEIAGKPYDELVSQKLMHTDFLTGKKKVVIADLAKELKVSSLGTPEFTIMHQKIPDTTLLFIVHVGGPDTVGYTILKYDVEKKHAETSPLEDLFKFSNGDLLPVDSSARYVWAPFIEGGINTQDRTMYLVDFSTETSSIIISLPETETLNGADHCDRFNFITDITVTNGMLKYAVYSRTKLNELYADACSGNGDNELQAKNAQEAFLEYRTLAITDIDS